LSASLDLGTLTRRSRAFNGDGTKMKGITVANTLKSTM
jgi:hypothetical protein